MNQGLSSAVLFHSVGVWRKAERIGPDAFKAAALAADMVLEMNPPGSQISVEIQHFGPCSYLKCAAVAAVFVCSRAKTEHVDSPFLQAARDGKLLADLTPLPETTESQ